MKLDSRKLLVKLGVTPLSEVPADAFLERIITEQNTRTNQRRQAQRARAGKRLDVQILTDEELDVLLGKGAERRAKRLVKPAKPEKG